MDPHTGRVLAMVGGFSFSGSEFNRATQAMRQPGSSFKPFVYAAALDNGYTPASVVLDAPITIKQGNQVWEPKNYGGEAAGPSTLRAGIERSRNLMTVRLANDMGMKLVVEYAERFGIYDNLLPYLPMSLGAGETTVMRMVSAYSIIANGGKQIKPSMIDRIQDRYGKTVYKHDERGCEGCVATSWLEQPEPELVDNSEQVLDPMTAYQVTSMMEGVVQRGTAVILSDLGRPIAGKTGTTNEEKDAWFVGYTPDMVVAVFMGYRQSDPDGQGLHRRRSRGADLQGLHGGGAQGQAGGRLSRARRHDAHRDQPQDRHARQQGRAEHDHGSVQAWHRSGRHLLGYRFRNGWRGTPEADFAVSQPGDPDGRRRALLILRGCRAAAYERAIWPEDALHGRAASLCSPPIQKRETNSMRAETENFIDEIKQGVTLLRRHL
jgi:membrane peptidoglycan carboxypeptidase